MIDTISLPPELNTAVGHEKTDFVMRSTSFKPVKDSVGTILIGSIFFLPPFCILIYILLEVVLGKQPDFNLLAWGNLLGRRSHHEPVVGAIISMLGGLGFLIFGAYPLFKRAGIFVSTPTRLIFLQNTKIRIMNWTEFTDKIEILGDKQNTILLRFKKGWFSTVGQGKDGTGYAFPRVLYICAENNLLDVAKICTWRIAENNAHVNQL